MPRGGIRPGQGRKKEYEKRQYVSFTRAQVDYIRDVGRKAGLNFAESVRRIIDVHRHRVRLMRNKDPAL